MNRKKLAGAVAFILIGAILFSLAQSVLIEKESGSYLRYRAFREQDEIDILILGNSHSQAAIDAVQIEDHFRTRYGTEVTAFNYSVFGIRMEQLYFFVKELFKTHVPDQIIVETYVFCPMAEEHREILARRAFDTLPLSRNKIEAIRYCVREDYWSYYIPFIKYHTRWKELSPGDLETVFDGEKLEGVGKGGTAASTVCPDPGDGWFGQDSAHIDDLRELTPSEKECLDRLVALAEENGVELIFVGVPFRNQMGLDSVEMIKINNYIRENYVNGSTVRMIDLNRMWQEMDFDYADLADEGHVNVSGRDKVMEALLPMLTRPAA